MKLTSVFVRFYKSFNYDYLRKIEPNVDRKPWEIMESRGGQFYPFVEMKIDPKTTAIVGANGSGKSHLLSAVQKGINKYSVEKGRHKNIEDKDLCRYSPCFSSKQGEQHFPDFGFAWALDAVDQARWAANGELSAYPAPPICWTFRFNNNRHVIYVPRGEGCESIPVSADVLLPLMPHVFRIDSAVALPDSVPIRQLIKGKMDTDGTWNDSGREFALRTAEKAPLLRAAIGEMPVPAISSYSTVPISTVSQELHERLRVLSNELAPVHNQLRLDERVREAERFNLAYDLLFEIAQVDKQQIPLLDKAIREGESGLMISIVDNINALLEKCLNFPRLWAQDRDFRLRVNATEHELAFVITDRTGKHYTFDERSSGLKHFLSYYIQFLAHKPQRRSEILLMDEPDAFLSAEAQQDLLKVFEMFASQTRNAQGEAVPVQVVYVTHSPFLIDKNHSERVRAIVKGEGELGTRVVKGEAHNHYEPLRSAFGAFVGETAFISGCNLMLEGQGDQILLAGTAAYLRRLENVPESEMLDLNRITLVPGGGGMSVAYLAYLARGRDTEKPAVIVLLDSDKEGDDSKVALSKNGPHPNKKVVVAEKYIFQLGQVKQTDVDAIQMPEGGNVGSTENGALPLQEGQMLFVVLEDLIPLPLMARAAKVFAAEVFGLSETQLDGITSEAISEKLAAMRAALQSEALTDNTALENATPPKKSAKKKGDATTATGHYLSGYEALNALLQEMPVERTFEISKVALARTVVDLLPVLAAENAKTSNGIESGLLVFERTMRALFRHLRAMQSDSEQDVHDKQQRQRVKDKIVTFRNNYEDDPEVSRDAARTLFEAIERDFDGNDLEQAFIVRELQTMRSNHGLREDLTEPVRDLPSFWDGLDRLLHTKELARRDAAPAVASRKSVSASLPMETEPTATNVAVADPIDEDEVSPLPTASAVG